MRATEEQMGVAVGGVVQSVIDWKCKLRRWKERGSESERRGQGANGQCRGDPTDGHWSV